MTVFGMVTTSKSSQYTLPSLRSFFRHTPLTAQDRVLLIDNDADYELIQPFDRLEVVRNEKPRGFAENVNTLLRHAAAAGADMVFLSNDVIYSPNWLPPLRESERAILIPLCNQYKLYSYNGFSLAPAMNLEEYLGHEDDFIAIVNAHNADFGSRKLLDHPRISFFCFRIPRPVYSALGLFDEGFGRGGGEDADYRIRAHLAGFDVQMAAASYLLHFAGKSTWRGGESLEERRAREVAYLSHFYNKWGPDLAQIFLFVGNLDAAVAKYDLLGPVQAGDFRRVVETVLARRAHVNT